MRTVFLVTVATLALGGPALADGGAGGGFSPWSSPFVTWQQEGAAGKHLTPMANMWVHSGAPQNAYANDRNGVPQGYAGAPNVHAPNVGG